MAKGKITKSHTDHVQDEEWEEVQAGEIVKFELRGQEVVGTLVRERDGKYGRLFDVVKDDGVKCTLPSDTVLLNRITPDMVGRRIKVVFLGFVKPSGGGPQYKDYQVYVSAGAKRDVPF